LPTTISDKLRSKLYKIYKKKTGLDPWIKSETSESPQSENADNHIIQDSSLETQVMAPNKNRLYQYVIEHGKNFQSLQRLRKIGGTWDVFVGIWKEIYISIVVE